MAKHKFNKKNDKKNSNEKDDILRSEDIIPPFDKDPASQKIKRPKQTKSRTDVPKFDLAGEIMAEQRKIIGIKRKSPEQKIEPLRTTDELKSKETTKGPVIEPIAEQVIKEIVARDIERFCQGESLDS